MATTPRINYPDGSGSTTELLFSTNSAQHFFTGTVDGNTIVLQVKVNDGDWVTDSDLVSFDLPSFMFPSPTAYPNGYSFPYGKTTISLRSVDILGGVSLKADITVTRVATSSLNIVLESPSGLSVRRHLDNVDIICTESDQDAVTGYNVYASTEAGGGRSGYLRVNKDLITEAAFQNLETYDIAEQSLEFDSYGSNVIAVVKQEDDLEELLEDTGELSFDVFQYPDASLLLTMALTEQRLLNYYQFTHTRGLSSENSLNNSTFAGIPVSDNLYYVFTAVAFDADIGEYVESPRSSEVVGLPIQITTTTAGIPRHTQQQLASTYIAAVLRVESELNMNPGSTVKNVHINPFTSEIERLEFIADYVSRAGSFVALLEIDDADGDGISDDVAVSPYKITMKSAFYVTNNTTLQGMVDAAFDHLASNQGISRLGETYGKGSAIFYTTKQPTRSQLVSGGDLVATSEGLQYSVDATVVMDADNASAYWNPAYRRYEIRANLTAVTPGTISNVSAGKIKVVSSGAAGFSVTNDSPIRYGREEETNRGLTERCILAFCSVDAGTEGGYRSTAISTSGVTAVKVVIAGDQYMDRDWDPLRELNQGGKVDVWIRGDHETEYTEKFAFRYIIGLNKPMTVIDPTNLVFEADDASLSADNPISGLLYDLTVGYGFRNVTTGEDYDTTNAQIATPISYPTTWWKTVILDTTLTQPVTSLDDVISADYKSVATNTFIPDVQPIHRVVSVIGELSGTLTEGTHYDLYKPEDPMFLGESTAASDYVKIVPSGGIPSGIATQVNDETHVLIGEKLEPLFNIGVNSLSIKVYNDSRTTEYVLGTDYTLLLGDEKTATYFKRLDTGSILDGESLSVDYQHDENFTITYVSNRLLHDVQDKVNLMRHVCADVLVKQSIEVGVDMDFTVVLKQGTQPVTVEGAIRSSLANEMNRKANGTGFFQSDAAWAVEEAHSDVVYCPIPFRKMVRSDGMRMVRDPVVSTSYTRLSSLELGPAFVYIIEDALTTVSVDGGGTDKLHYGVFQDKVMLTNAASLSLVGSAVRQGWIIGKAGASIAGYSDDATLELAGFLSSAEKPVERLRRTARHIVVSLEPGAGGTVIGTPADHSYSATYTVDGATGASDIETSDLQFVSPGKINIVYKIQGSDAELTNPT